MFGFSKSSLGNISQENGYERNASGKNIDKSKEKNTETSVEQDAIAWEERTKPTIGLALGGGAARGWAHIGVLHALDEAGIKPDIIAGTSIGSVVGGCYAAGKLDDIEAFARSLSPRRIFGLLDPIFGGAGLFNGRKLASLLEKDLGHQLSENLPIRMISVATELATGHEIWLRRGSLVHSMRASYALPGIFKPVEMHKRILVDGALVNPVPVSVCRAYGARVVIAVGLNPEFAMRGTVVPNVDDFEDEIYNAEDSTSYQDDRHHSGGLRMMFDRHFSAKLWAPGGIPSVMMQAYNIIQDRVTRSRLAGDPPDLMITPRLPEIGLFDFHKAEKSIEAGYEAASKALDDARIALETLS